MPTIPLLIVGAGPYGLATARYARAQGLDFLLVGEPMGFWKHCMPGGMLLRSPLGWHCDPLGQLTVETYLESRRLHRDEVDPIPIEVFLDYARWFQQESQLEAQESYVQRLEYRDGTLEAIFQDGTSVSARNVVVTPGLRPFKSIPDELASALPQGRYTHTCDLVDFGQLQGKRCLIVGGRQSAFEWAALVSEQADAEVHVVHRHETPSFAASDWSWLYPMIDSTLQIPGWFRSLPAQERAAIDRRMWSEGRLKLEPWLAPRLAAGRVRLWPSSRIGRCAESPGGALEIGLDTGASLSVDHVILATGYRVDLGKVPYLSSESIQRALKLEEGYPVLDEAFQSSVPGLFVTGQPATRDFGPFFGFVIGSPPAARMIVDRIIQQTISQQAQARKAPHE